MSEWLNKVNYSEVCQRKLIYRVMCFIWQNKHRAKAASLNEGNAALFSCIFLSH
uniref:Uncharacterized protein n=1 Tax=Anguilla anguilla TaxID=7936 RepID=A0A0E9P8C8_ANGAN